MTCGTLYIVPTPIGHLKDITQRALDVFKNCDCLLAEDTRVTRKLLTHFDIHKPLHSYNEFASSEKVARILKELSLGKNLALVSDAGTPAVSDPGARLVHDVLAHGYNVIPLPGASAVTTLVSAFGQPSLGFHFWGFFPIKKKKQRQWMDFFHTIPGIHVFFESPYRVLKTLNLFLTEEQDDFHFVVGREMTKNFETFYRGSASLVRERLQHDQVKGEFCLGLIKIETK